MRVSLFLLLLVAPAAVGRNPFLSAEAQRGFRAYLPKTDDPALQAVYAKDPWFYTQKEMPRAFQSWDGPVQGLVSVTAPGIRHPNNDFPWSRPAGIPEDSSAKSIRFVHLAGPITWKRERLSGDDDPQGTITWEYAPGTVFGEVLTIHGSDGQDWPFEVRTRRKGEKGWAANAFRPFETYQELREAVSARGWKLPGHGTTQRQRLKDPLGVFDRVATAHHLPELPAGRWLDLLRDTPFKSIRDREWIPDSAGPTTEQAFSLVPRGFFGAFVHVGRQECMTCHETAGRHGRSFRADWGGRVRGSDGIFSFHPFDPASISTDGAPRPVRLRRELVNEGLLQKVP
jgi:hypothetical protein